MNLSGPGKLNRPKAVWHDAKKIPEEIKENLIWIKKILGYSYYANTQKKQ